MRIDDEGRKSQALYQLNHSLDLGSLPPDTLKCSRSVTKMESEEGVLF